MPQFEVEPLTAYSGSYADDIVTGSLVSRVGNTITSGDRGKVGSRVFGDDYEFATATSLHDLAFRYSGRTINKAGFKRSVDYLCPDERFYDTLVPDFRTITAINGAQFIAPNWYSIYYPLLNNSPNNGTLKLIIAIGNGLIKGNVVASGSLITISDNYWWNTCPFENRYANAKRIPNFNSAFVSNSYVEWRYPDSTTGSAGGILSWSLNTADLGGGSGPATTMANEVTRSNKFLISYALGNNSGSDKLILINMYDYALTVTGKNPLTYSQTLAKNLEDAWFIKLYYGYFKGTISVNSLTASGDYTAGSGHVYNPGLKEEVYVDPTGDIRPFVGHTLTYFSFAPPIPNGWKYGLMNGFPQYTKAVYRIGHYGHLRDMLEQRQYSKFYIERDGTVTSSPVAVTFSSGTQDYLTSSTPSLNTRGMGAFDFECKASKPFSDI